MSNLKISIITACYNSADTIEDTIRSVVYQSHPDIEYIIVDGLSTDNTMAIVEKYQDRIATVVSEKDEGIFDAFNKGIALATGDIVGIINSDDFYTNDQVITQVARAFEQEKADVVYGDLLYVDWNKPDKNLRYWRSRPYKKSLFKYGWMPPHPTFFVRRKLYEQYGNFNTWMKISNDYEIILRFLYKHDAPAYYLPETLIKMRAGGNSNGSLRKRYIANMEDRASWRINGLKMPFFAMYLKPLRKLGQYLLPKYRADNRNKRKF